MQKRYWRVGFHLFRFPRPLRSSNFFSPEVTSTHLHLLPFAILVPSIHSRIWNKCSYSGYMILKFWNRGPVLFCTFVQCLVPYIFFVLRKPEKQSRRKRGFFYSSLLRPSEVCLFRRRQWATSFLLPSTSHKARTRNPSLFLFFSSRFLPPFSAKPRNGWRKGEEGGGIGGNRGRGRKVSSFPRSVTEKMGRKEGTLKRRWRRRRRGPPTHRSRERRERTERGGPGCLAAASSLVGLGLTTVRRSLAGHFIHGAEREKIPRGVLMGPPISRR